MKKFLISFVIIGMTCVLAVANVWAASIADQIRNQQNRIDKGIASGDLTANEAQILQNNLNAIKARYARATAMGRPSSSELEEIERELRANGERIAAGRHNRAQVLGISGFEVRIADQQKKISRGVSTGALTKNEAAVLLDNLNWIKTSLRRMKRDGTLTPSEQTRMDRMLEENSTMIYLERHDANRVAPRRLY